MNTDKQVKPAFICVHLILSVALCEDTLLVKETKRVLYVVSEWWDTLKPRPLIQADGRLLMNAGFQAKEANSMSSGMVRQMIEQ